MNQKTKDMVSAALCVALGLIVPQVFHLIPFVGTVPNLGGVFLPMHIPVLLCGLLCGWRYGAACGAVVPLLSSVVTGMPVLWPQGVSMVFELAAYGLVAGLLYRGMKKGVYPALVAAMVAGRLVSGAAKAILFGMAGKPFGMAAFLSGAFTTASFCSWCCSPPWCWPWSVPASLPPPGRVPPPDPLFRRRSACGSLPTPRS